MSWDDDACAFPVCGGVAQPLKGCDEFGRCSRSFLVHIVSGLCSVVVPDRGNRSAKIRASRVWRLVYFGEYLET